VIDQRIEVYRKSFFRVLHCSLERFAPRLATDECWKIREVSLTLLVDGKRIGVFKPLYRKVLYHNRDFFAPLGRG
jgi:hypothetical protein